MDHRNPVAGNGGARSDPQARAYERSGVAEVWLVHPTDRIVTVYRHTGKGYGRPDAYELEGTLAPQVLPAVKIAWARVLREA